MKIKFILLLLLTLIFNFSLFSQDLENKEAQQISLVARFLKNSNTPKMQQVWPNYNLRSKPLLITFGNGHIYAFNIKFQEPEWKRKNIEGVELFYTDKDRWGITTSPMQFNFEINGQEAFVFRLDMMPEPIYLPFFVMVHERFHVYQIDSFKSEQNTEEGEHIYRESDNTENLALMQLEELILLDFIKALDRNAQDEALRDLKTFISVNRERRKLLSTESIQWEAHQQIVEGLADYAAAKNFDVFSYFGYKLGQKHILQTMERYTNDDDITERALKWRHYGVGASLGYALDFLSVPNWKFAVENNVPLQVILEKNLNVSQQEADCLKQQAMQKYGFSKLQKEIKEKVTAYNTMLREHQEKFQTSPGVMVKVQNPPDSGLSAGGHSRGIYSLADGSMFSVEDTSKTSSADNRWILELRSMPYLYQSNDGFRRFKENKEELVLVIDGQPCPLNNLKRRTFHQLTLKGKSSSFQSVYNQGTVSLRNGELSITYM